MGTREGRKRLYSAPVRNGMQGGRGAGPGELWAGLGAAALSGGALGAIFPSLGWDWLAWVALVPLWMAIARAGSAGRALLYGYVTGVIFFGLSCPWIQTTIAHYGGLSPGMAGIIFGLFLLLMGSYVALFGWLGYALGRGLGHRLLPLPFLWVAIELLRTYTPMGGFPWNLLGYSQYEHAGFMLVAPVAGVYGASLLLALANTFLAALLLRAFGGREPWPRRLDAWLGVGLGLILAYATLPYHPPPNTDHDLHARLVQPDTPLTGSWDNARLEAFLQEQLKLSVPRQAQPKLDLVLWPEQPAPIDYALQPSFQAATAQLTSATQAAFLFDQVTYPLSRAGELEVQQPRNSAQLIHADGTTGSRYDKMHLVPFGEYVPLPAWLRKLGGVGKLVEGVGDFVPGREQTLFEVRGHRLAALICYESIFPGLSRQAVRHGAEWLVNLSDDAWYGRSSAGAQGLMMAQVRAMENRRWLLRDTNDGYTAVVDPYGRITAELPRFQAGALTAGFEPRTALTFYTRHGDWCAYLCCVLAGVMGLGAAVLGRHRLS